MLNLKAGDFSTGVAQFNVFIFGEYCDFTQKYHNSKAHIVCSLTNNIGLIIVDIGALKPEKYGLRVEGIIDPKDDGSRFDIDTRTFTTPKMITRSRYKEKIDPRAVAMDMEIEVRNELRNYIYLELILIMFQTMRLLCLSLEEEVKDMLIRRVLTTSTIMRR